MKLARARCATNASDFHKAQAANPSISIINQKASFAVRKMNKLEGGMGWNGMAKVREKVDASNTSHRAFDYMLAIGYH